MLFDSGKKLKGVETMLALLVIRLSQEMDIVVVCGHRSKTEQDAAFRAGNSAVKFPNSGHNKKPSIAVDLAPCDSKGNINWEDYEKFHKMQARIRELATEQGVELRPIIHLGKPGRQWPDLPHVELKV